MAGTIGWSPASDPTRAVPQLAKVIRLELPKCSVDSSVRMHFRFSRRFGQALAALVVAALLFGVGAGAAHASHEGSDHELCVFCPLAHHSATESGALDAVPGDDAPTIDVLPVASSGGSNAHPAAPASRGPPSDDSFLYR
ncbi:MAG: hypothetical protein ACI9OJ_004725 [Myxococcota bacterium]